MKDFYYYFLIFFIYCVIGYISETLFVYFRTKKLVNRGFLIGPYLPIYGVGGVLITFLLTGYYNDPIVVFTFSFIICSCVEYFTSFALEKIFKRKWWDYSYRKYHINGRVCLLNSTLFGVGGLFTIYLANQYIFAFVLSIPAKTRMIASLIIIIILIADSTASIINIIRTNNIAGHLDTILNEYTKNNNIKINRIRTRLFDAFPYIEKNPRRVERLKSLKKDFSKRKKLRK